MATQVDSVKHIGIRVSPTLHERFREAARANHRSIEGELKFLIEQRIAEHVSREKAAA